MNSKPAIPLFVATFLIAGLAVSSAAMAAEKTEATVEKHVEQGESAIKDAWMHGMIESALLFNEHINSFDIDTDVENSVAYLRGAVESDIDRDLAGEIAKSVDGVTKVENELVVDKAKASLSKNDESTAKRHGFKQSVSDATLTARVKTKLLMNGNTGGIAIDVDSKQGVVTLSGDVKSNEEKDLAVKLAANTSGAVTVTDQLVVKAD